VSGSLYLYIKKSLNCTENHPGEYSVLETGVAGGVIPPMYYIAMQENKIREKFPISVFSVNTPYGENDSLEFNVYLGRQQPVPSEPNRLHMNLITPVPTNADNYSLNFRHYSHSDNTNTNYFNSYFHLNNIEC
jgi:hypothetical protein